MNCFFSISIFSSVLHLLAIFFKTEYVTAKEKVMDWGPFETVHESIVQCRGPKSVNLASGSLLLKVHPKTGRSYYFGNNTNVRSAGPVMASIQVRKWVNNKFQALLTISGNCEKLPALRNFFVDSSDIIDTRCYLKPGFSIMWIDASVLTRNLFGDNFFYGRYKLGISTYTPKANVRCFHVVLNIIDSRKRKTFMDTFNKMFNHNNDTESYIYM